MIYVPKKPQLVHAFKFNGVSEESIKHNIRNIPPNLRGNCQCGYSLALHGYHNGQLVCPNTYIMYEGDSIINVMSSANFESIYRPLSGDDEVMDIEPVEVGKEDGESEEGDSCPGSSEEGRGEEATEQ